MRIELAILNWLHKTPLSFRVLFISAESEGYTRVETVQALWRLLDSDRIGFTRDYSLILLEGVA